MSLPENAIFGAELFNMVGPARREPVGGSAVPPTRIDAADEVAYLRYGSPVLTRLGEACAPLSDRALYQDIRTDAGDSFPQFRRALDGMVGRGVLMIAGKEPEFGDPLYALSMPPG